MFCKGPVRDTIQRLCIRPAFSQRCEQRWSIYKGRATTTCLDEIVGRLSIAGEGQQTVSVLTTLSLSLASAALQEIADLRKAASSLSLCRMASQFERWWCHRREQRRHYSMCTSCAHRQTLWTDALLPQPFCDAFDMIEMRTGESHDARTIGNIVEAHGAHHAVAGAKRKRYLLQAHLRHLAATFTHERVRIRNKRHAAVRANDGDGGHSRGGVNVVVVVAIVERRCRRIDKVAFPPSTMASAAAISWIVRHDDRAGTPESFLQRLVVNVIEIVVSHHVEWTITGARSSATLAANLPRLMQNAQQQRNHKTTNAHE